MVRPRGSTTVFWETVSIPQNTSEKHCVSAASPYLTLWASSNSRAYFYYMAYVFYCRLSSTTAQLASGWTAFSTTVATTPCFAKKSTEQAQPVKSTGFSSTCFATSTRRSRTCSLAGAPRAARDKRTTARGSITSAWTSISRRKRSSASSWPTSTDLTIVRWRPRWIATSRPLKSSLLCARNTWPSSAESRESFRRIFWTQLRATAKLMSAAGWSVFSLCTTGRWRSRNRRSQPRKPRFATLSKQRIKPMPERKASLRQTGRKIFHCRQTRTNPARKRPRQKSQTFGKTFWRVPTPLPCARATRNRA